MNPKNILRSDINSARDISAKERKEINAFNLFRQAYAIGRGVSHGNPDREMCSLYRLESLATEQELKKMEVILDGDILPNSSLEYLRQAEQYVLIGVKIWANAFNVPKVAALNVPEVIKKKDDFVKSHIFVVKPAN